MFFAVIEHLIRFRLRIFEKKRKLKFFEKKITQTQDFYINISGYLKLVLKNLIAGLLESVKKSTISRIGTFNFYICQKTYFCCSGIGQVDKLQFLYWQGINLKVPNDTNYFLATFLFFMNPWILNGGLSNPHRKISGHFVTMCSLPDSSKYACAQRRSSQLKVLNFKSHRSLFIILLLLFTFLFPPL